MGLFVNQGGVWTEVKELHTNQGGNWVPVTEALVNDGGVWKRYFPPYDTIKAIIIRSMDYTPIGSLVTFRLGGGGGGGGACGKDYENNIAGSGGGGGGEVIIIEDYVMNGETVTIDVGVGGRGGAYYNESGLNGGSSFLTLPDNSVVEARGGEGGGAATEDTPGTGGTFYARGGDGGDGTTVDGQPGEDSILEGGGDPGACGNPLAGGGGGGGGVDNGGDGEGEDGNPGAAGGGNCGVSNELSAGGDGGVGVLEVLSLIYDPSEPHHLYAHRYLLYEYRVKWLRDGNVMNTAPMTTADIDNDLEGGYMADPTGRFDNILTHESHSIPEIEIDSTSFSLWINYTDFSAGGFYYIIRGADFSLYYDTSSERYVINITTDENTFIYIPFQEVTGEWVMLSGSINPGAGRITFWRNIDQLEKEPYEPNGGNPTILRVDATVEKRIGPIRFFDGVLYSASIEQLYELGE